MKNFNVDWDKTKRPDLDYDKLYDYLAIRYPGKDISIWVGMFLSTDSCRDIMIEHKPYTFIEKIEQYTLVYSLSVFDRGQNMYYIGISYSDKYLLLRTME